MQDYCIAYGLVSDLMAYGVQTAVPPGVRKFVDAVKALTPEFPVGEPLTTTKKAVTRFMQVDNSYITGLRKEAVKQGYVVNLESNDRRPARLCLGDPLPEDNEVLPSPERLLATIKEEEQRLAA
jgi:hypothetical protein